MFIFIPFLLILCSVAGIFAVIWRKKSYLDKLYALNTAGGANDVSVSGTNFSLMGLGADFFPEVKALLDKFRIYEHKMALLVETEKFLRKTRLVSLRIDRWSDALIKKIRKVHLNGQLNGKIANSSAETDKEIFFSNSDKNLAKDQTVNLGFLKNEEQRLVMEIAKNPKDPNLYEALGDLYMEMDNWADAKESYEASIELNPQNEPLKIKLSSALEKLVQK